MHPPAYTHTITLVTILVLAQGCLYTRNVLSIHRRPLSSPMISNAPKAPVPRGWVEAAAAYHNDCWVSSALGIHRVPYDLQWNIEANSEHEENDKILVVVADRWQNVGVVPMRCMTLGVGTYLNCREIRSFALYWKVHK